MQSDRQTDECVFASVAKQSKQNRLLFGLPRHFVPRKDVKAFTLAEVLITLGIIGVVAALTIPTLIANNQKTQYVTALKKAVTGINQAIVQVAADNGCVGDLVCTNLFDGNSFPLVDNGNQDGDGNPLMEPDYLSINDRVGSEIAKHFKVAKTCGVNTDTSNPDNDCFGPDFSPYLSGEWREGNTYNAYPSYKFVTADGMSWAIQSNGDNCSTYCATVHIDVNGPKGPNTNGRDLFPILVLNKNGPHLGFQGSDSDPWAYANGYKWKTAASHQIWGCSTTADWSGNGCAARIIEEGWQMNY